MGVYVVWILLFTVTSYSKISSVRLLRARGRLMGGRCMERVSRTEYSRG